MSEVSQQRQAARRVAKHFVEKGNAADAVAVLAAWAAAGPNDAEGQDLLAEALRVDPGSRVAKMAFERMEGIAGDHGELDASIARFAADALAKLEQSLKKPVFHRAQIGFNNNVIYKEARYHVQTEDSGLDRPHVITHLFADGGRIIKSHKRVYAGEVARADVAAYVRSLMKAQHMEMCIMLREGKFDDVVAGLAVGGMETLEHAPEVRVKKGAGERVAAAETPPPLAVAQVTAVGPAGAPTPAAMPAAEAPLRFRLTLMRSLWGGSDVYEPRGDDVTIGRDGDVKLEGERFASREEAVLRWREGKLFLVDLEGGNGVFVRIRTPVELDFGDEVMVGDQLLRLGRNPEADDWPDPGPTYFYSSPRWTSSFRVVQLWEGGKPGAVVVAHGPTAQIGRAVGDIIFEADPLVADQHCIFEEQAGAIVLTDFGSRAGTFVRVTREQELVDGDEIAVGRTRLRISLVGGG